jgi:hypothetical protein
MVRNKETSLRICAAVVTNANDAKKQQKNAAEHEPQDLQRKAKNFGGADEPPECDNRLVNNGHHKTVTARNQRARKANNEEHQKSDGTLKTCAVRRISKSENIVEGCGLQVVLKCAVQRRLRVTATTHDRFELKCGGRLHSADDQLNHRISFKSDFKPVN